MAHFIMKVAQPLNRLEYYGFSFYSKEDAKIEFDEDGYMFENNWVFNVGHSRRGQFYYITVNTKGTVELYASRPDGTPGSIDMPDVLIDLVADGILIK
jgi:hypothetical protein